MAPLVVLPLACALSALWVVAAYQEAFHEGVFSEAIWDELGGVWVVNSIASGLLPVVLTCGAVGVMRWRGARSDHHQTLKARSL